MERAKKFAAVRSSSLRANEVAARSRGTGEAIFGLWARPAAPNEARFAIAPEMSGFFAGIAPAIVGFARATHAEQAAHRRKQFFKER
jgi:hypothetical protein